MEALLEKMNAEEFVLERWDNYSPLQIARCFNDTHNCSWMTQKWVCSIHQRLDRWMREGEKE